MYIMELAKEKPTPLSREFDFWYYEKLYRMENLQKKSVKFLFSY